MAVNKRKSFMKSLVIIAATVLVSFGISTSILTTFAQTPKTPFDVMNESAVVLDNTCSGQIVDLEKDLIATAAHCVSKIGAEVSMTKYTFDLNGGTVTEFKFKGKVVAIDSYNDMALIQTKLWDIRSGAVTLSTKPVEYGDLVYSIGNPVMIYGMIASGSVTKPAMGSNPFSGVQDEIVTDAASFMGSSGGMLLNASGEMVGMTNSSVCGHPSSGRGCSEFRLANPVKHLISLIKKYKGQ